MSRLLVITLLSLGVILSNCGNNQTVQTPSTAPRNCDCPIPPVLSEAELRETTKIKLGNDASGQLSIGGDLYNYFEGEIKAGLSITEESQQTRVVLEKIRNDFSEFNGAKFTYTIGRLYACARYDIRCRDTGVSDSELSAAALSDVDAFQAKYDATQVTGKSQPTPVNPPQKVEQTEFSGLIKEMVSGQGLRGVVLIVEGKEVGKTGSVGNFSFPVTGDYTKRKLRVHVSKSGFRDTTFLMNPYQAGTFHIQPN